MTLVPELFVRRLNKPKGLPINVRDVSVTGDGQTDDYAALNEAVRSAGATGTLYFPAGTYVVGTNLTIPACCIFAFGAKIKPSSGVTVTLSGPVEFAPGESVIATGTAGTVSITGSLESSGGVLDVRAFGAVGDGVTDDTAAIDAADAAASASGILVPPGTYALASNLTITSPITFLPGAKLRPASGVTVTISGQVLAGPYQQIFDISAGGTARITSRGATETFVTWWGAIGNGSTDDTTEFQAAINNTWNVTGDTGSQAKLRVPKGAYLISSPLIIGKNTTIDGDGGANFSTQIVVSSAFSGDALFQLDGALVVGGFAFRNFFRRFLVDCSAPADSTVLPKVFNIVSSYTVTLEDVYLHNAVGVGVFVDDSNDVLIDRCKMFSRASPRGDRALDLRGTSSVTVRECDIEVWTVGIYQQEASKVTVLGGYGERNINQWQCAGASNGSMTVVGGAWYSPGVSGFAGAITGQNCTVLGGYYSAAGGSGLATDLSAWRNVRIYGAIGDVQNIPSANGSVSADRGNVGVTVTWQQDASTQIFNTALTADRAVTLSTTNAQAGARFRIVRGAGATGAFNLNVGTGPLKALAAAGQWCDVEYSGTAWVLTASGSL